MGSNSEEIRLSLKPFGGKEVVSEISRRRKWQSLGRIQMRKRAWGSLVPGQEVDVQRDTGDGKGNG